MAVFIPERGGKAGAAKLKLKSVLKELDDSYIVRFPVRSAQWAPDCFVQRSEDRWLALAVCHTPFPEIVSDDLFSSTGREDFETLLAGFSALAGIPEATSQSLPKLFLMWACNAEEARRLSSLYLGRFGVRLYAREQFLELGSKLVRGLIAPLGEDGSDALMGACFPEAEIHPEHTTRRHFHRDNSARLPRYFLDHHQEWAAKLDIEPPEEQSHVAGNLSVRLINGVAGSGKTLISISRAILLAELHPDEKVLLLIHNAPIVADLRARMFRSRGGLPSNLEVNTFYAWATAQWRAVFGRWPEIEKYADQVEKIIEARRERWPGLRPGASQLRQELDFINESLFTDEAAYLQANRSGRGFSLRGTERSDVWALYQDVTSLLKRQGRRLWSAIPRDVCLAECHDAVPRAYHILIDEAQFFAPSWFQMVKLALDPTGDLFLCADPNQGFMKNRLSWKSAGLDVVGRTRKLRKSYRSTRAILAAASHILAGRTQGDPEDYLTPDMEGMADGHPPLLITVDTPQDAVDRLGNELAAIVGPGHLPLGAALVLYGDRVSREMIHQRLGEHFGPEHIWCFARHRKYPPGDAARDYLRMASVESATGLEAGVVFLVGMENLLPYTLPPDIPAEDATALREENARKLYMAMTRAGQTLVLITTEVLPPDLEKSFRQVP